MAVDMLGSLKLPSISAGQMSQWAIIGGIGIMILLLVAGIGIIMYLNYVYNKKFLVFKKIAGKVVPFLDDTAMFERVGIAGDYWAKTRKSKKIVVRPKIEISKGTYWFFEREDGEWINFSLEDVDVVMREAKVFYIDEDMRLSRLAIQRNLADRLQKAGFWEKYGAMIGMLIFVIIITVCLVVLFTKLKDVSSALGAAATAIEKLANAMGDMAVKSGGGLLPAK